MDTGSSRIQWDEFSTWHYVLPPNRPTITYLVAIRSICKDYQRADPVCVLGSTPEIRDIFGEIGFENVFVLDASQRFYSYTSEIRAFQNKEIFISGDWLSTLPKFKDAFALVVSDLTSGNVPYEDRARFYQSISASLRHGGLFIDRVLTHSSPFLPLDLLDAKYSRLPYNLRSLNDFSSEYLFLSELVLKHGRVESSLFYRILSDRFSHPRLRVFLRECSKITPENCEWFYRSDTPERLGHGDALQRLATLPDEPGTVYSERTFICVSRQT